jgi:hypothetical protein
VRDRVPISVVIGTGEGWPYVLELVDALSPDVEAVRGEIVVADGSPNAPPSRDELGERVRWIKASGRSVFELYSVALRAATGDVVALTEDHAMPRLGWVPAILRAHAEHPEAAAIGGAIENGSTRRLVEWASYFTTQGPHMAPLGDREVAMTTNEADVSYKRWALERHEPSTDLGFMAILFNRLLAESGEVLRVDDRIVVDHFETTGLRWTTSIHFHNGRTIAGFRRARGMNREEWLRMSVALLLPAWRTMRAVRIGLGKRRLRRHLLASAPLALWLEYVQGAGHLCGYVLGAGRSPQHLR